jgi:leucyl/phenylalanyl-tRNA---protein transferase
VRLPAAPHFPDVLRPDAWSRVALGGPLTTETVLEAYRRGIFPWSGDDPVPWCAPDPRLVLRPGCFRSSRSLEKLARQGRYTVAFDRDFSGVMAACARVHRPGQDGTWITPRMIDVYTELHRRGVAHSVEVLHGGQLVGGLYGLALGRGFFGESMFALHPNTSKLALRALCRALEARHFHFVDCQQVTLHLLSLGARPIPLPVFLRWLENALTFPSLHQSWSDFESGPASPES